MGKFKLDENLPVEAADVLRAAGHDALTVLEQHMGGRPDTDVASVCRQEGRTVITLDLDFADIRAYPPAEYPGIVVLRLMRLDKRHVLAVMHRLSAMIDREPLEGKLWIVDETSVRIRR